MTPEEYNHLYELEERHWWFQGMRKITAALLEGAVTAEPQRILDAGCGTGLMLSWLRAYAGGDRVYGLDYNSRAVHYSARRGEKLLVQGSIAAIPFPNNCFDLVTAFDVLDSFSAEEAPTPIGELARVLREGGLLILRVPAFQSLYGRHDRAVYTKHRYTAQELRSLLEKQGWRVERLTYANSVLFPLAAAWRWLTRSGRGEPQSDVRPLPKTLRWLNPIFVWPLAMEAAWLRYLRWRLPFGLSVMALARKPVVGS